MKKIVLIFLFLFHSLFIYAQNNKVGISFGIINVDADVPIRECVGFSYEKTFYDYKELSIGGEVEVLLSPFVNFYALNLNSFVEFDFGIEIGVYRFIFSPLSFMNFSTLFAPDSHLNYLIGIGLCWEKEMSERIYLDARFMMALPVYSIEKTTNATLNLSMRYCF